MDETVEFHCAACAVALTRRVRELPDGTALNYEDGRPLLPAGHFAVEPDGVEASGGGHPAGRAPGRTLVNLADLVNTRHVADRRRLNGCCGLDGLDGPNVECLNGHEVGTEVSDCWTPHYLHFEPGRVTRERAPARRSA